MTPVFVCTLCIGQLFIQRIFFQSTSVLVSRYYKTGFLPALHVFFQVLITEDFLQRLDKDVDDLTRPNEVNIVIYSSISDKLIIGKGQGWIPGQA